MLMSYEREGWVDDEPARLTGRLEVRPAAELGPIIVCLDTSGGWLPACTCMVMLYPGKVSCARQSLLACAVLQAACMARGRLWPRRWRWSACVARTASSAAASSTLSGTNPARLPARLGFIRWQLMPGCIPLHRFA